MSRILVITAMRDEGAHLVDWIAHIRALGAEILAISNDCTDGSPALLDALAAGGAVTHVAQEVPEGRTPQWSALKIAERHPLTQEADWIAVLDADEYVNLRAPLASLQDLANSVDADAILLPWRLFGHAGHATRPEAPTSEAFTRAIAADALYPALCRFFKTLYRRAGPFRKPGVHRPRQTEGAEPRWVDGSGRPLSGAFAAAPERIMHWGAPLATGLVQLNHYSVRSAEEFLLKRERGLPNRTGKPIDLTYWVERNFNEVEDTTIDRHRPARRAEAARLRALPGVAAAEAGCLDHHRARFEALLADPDALTLYGRLLLAAGSSSPGRDAALRLVGLFQRASGDQRPG